MLLLTLLPFAGWAAPAIDGVPVNVGGDDHVVYLANQYVAKGSLSPVVNGVKIGNETYTGTDIKSFGVVDAQFNKAVEPLTTAGYYYKVIVVSADANNATRLYVPFYVGDPLTFDFIYNKESFDNSVTSGALKLYYAEYIAKYSEGGATPDPTQKEAYETERNNWSFAASNDPACGGSVKYFNGCGYPMIGFKAPEVEGSYKPALSYTGAIGTEERAKNSVNGDYVGENKLFATPWKNTVFGQADGLKKYGLVSTNALYGTGQIYHEIVEGVGADKQDVDYNFDREKFSAFWIPAEFDATVAANAKYELYSRILVQAIPFHVPYGTEFGEDFIVTPDMIAIREGNGSGATEEILVNYKDENDKPLFTFTKVTAGDWSAVNTTEGYKYKLTWSGSLYEVEGETGGEPSTFYDIVFLSDQSYCYVTKAVNSFKEGTDLPATIEEDLPYAGEPQTLLATEGTATFGKVEYAVVPSDKVTISDTDNSWRFAEGYTPTWGDEAKAEDVLYDKPAGEEGRQIISYYVFAKPAAGESWTEGDVIFVGDATIVKGTPKVVANFASVLDTYFYKTGGDHNLHAPITPTYEVYAVTGTDDLKKLVRVAKYDSEVVTRVRRNGNLLVAALPEFKADKPAADVQVPHKLEARFAENDNLNALANEDRPTKEFIIARPYVFVKAEADPAVIPFGQTPNFKVVAAVGNWQGGSYGETLNTENAQFTLKDENGNTVNPASDGNYPSGTYTIEVTGVTVKVPEGSNQAEPDHIVKNVEGENRGTLTIGNPDIYAKIDNYNTDETALIYGQSLPVVLKHVDGLTPATAPGEWDAIGYFESADRSWEFTATMIKDASGKTVTDATPFKFTKTDYLPVGTYNVTYVGQYETPFSNGNKFNVLTQSGVWKVIPKNLDNSDAQRAGYSVNYENFYTYTTSGWPGFRTPVNPALTYSGEPQLPTEALGKITWRGTVLKESIPAKEAAPAVADNPDTYVDEARPAQEAAAAVPGDYTIQVSDNINAAKDIVVKLLGEGNFCGESPELKFDINKKTVTVKPLNAEWTLCEDETNLYGIDWWDLFINGGIVPVDQDAYRVVTKTEEIGGKVVTYITSNPLKELDGFKDLTVRRLTGPNAGEFPVGIQAYLPEGKSVAANYEFTPGKGYIKINKGTIVLQIVSPVYAEYNGNQLPTLPEDYYFFTVDKENSTLSKVWYDNDNWKNLLQPTAAIDYTLKGGPADDAEDKRWYVGHEGYTLEIATTEAEKFSTTNFNITIEPAAVDVPVAVATVEVVPAKLDVTTKNQPENGEIPFELLDEQFENGIDQIELTANGSGLKPGDELPDLFGTKVYKEGQLQKVENAVTYDPETVTMGLNKEAIDVVPTALAANYEINVTKGSLNIGGASELFLTSEMADYVTKDLNGNELRVPKDWTKLQMWNQKPVSKISLELKAPKLVQNEVEVQGYNTWEADEWHAMVLPFDATVEEISKAFGYAYVNIVDPERTATDDVHFKLAKITQTIPANTPFCIKTYKAYAYGTALKFDRSEDEDFFMVDLTDVNEDWTVSVPAGMGYGFEGTYMEMKDMVIDNTKSYLRFLGNNSKWAKVSKEGTAYSMPPYTGFVNLTTLADTREVTFTFEEPDGSTTSIKAVDFSDGNKANAEGLYRVDGVKVQGATTQKGVYIQDGKKFVK